MNKGKEFYSSTVENILKRYNVPHFSSYQEVKVQIVERLNRTLHHKMKKYGGTNSSLRYLNILQTYFWAIILSFIVLLKAMH